MLSFVFQVRMTIAINEKTLLTSWSIKTLRKAFCCLYLYRNVIFPSFLRKPRVIHSSRESARGEIYTIEL